MPGQDERSANDVAAENVAYFLKRRGLSRRELAHRMNALGLSAWKHEKTVRRVVDPETESEKRKRITTEELVALALALETTVETLLTPGVETYADKSTDTMRVYSGDVTIGELSIPSGFFLSVVSRRKIEDRPSPSEVGAPQPSRLVWNEWDRNEDEGEPPRWNHGEGIADALDQQRLNTRDLFTAAGKDAPDDLDTVDQGTLQQYHRQAILAIREALRGME